MGGLSRTQRWALLGVLLGAFGVRLAWCVYAAHEPVGFHDPAFYRLLAHQLARFDGYVLEGEPTAYYPIGYPAVLGAAFLAGRVVGADGPAAETAITTALNLAAAMAGVWLTFLLGRRVAGAWAGVVAAGIVAVLPNLVFHTSVALTETLFLPVALAFALVLADARWSAGGPTAWRLAGAGVLLGAAALIRPVVLPSLLLLPAVWLASRLGWRRALRDVAVLGIVAAAVIAPWTIRNAVRMDAFVPISTNTGDNLCMSRQPGAQGGFLLTDHCFGGPDLAGVERPDYELRRDAQGRRLALEFLREHPGREVELWFGRLGATFHHDHDGLLAVEDYGSEPFLSDGERDVYRRLADGAWFVLAAASIVALAVAAANPALRRNPGAVLVVAVAAGTLVPVVAFFGDARFKVPAIPFVAVLVAAAATSVLAARERRDPSPRASPTS